MPSKVSRSKTMPALVIELASTVVMSVNRLPTIAMLLDPPLIVPPEIVAPSRWMLPAFVKESDMVAPTPGGATIDTWPAFWPPENEP